MPVECVSCGAPDHQPEHVYCGHCGAPLPEEAARSGLEGRGRERFVGRDDELRALERVVGLSRQGRSGLIEIRGEVGIGKTRLVAELLRHSAPDVVARHARCRAAGLVPFGPWLGLLRSWSDGPGATEAARVAESLTAREAPRAGDRTELARSLAGFLRAAEETAREGASLQVLVFDDLHAADPTSLFTLRHLACNRSLATLFVVTTGPELPRDWHGDARLVRVDLKSLPGPDRLTMARDLLAPLPDWSQLAEIAVERAGGNPLYIEHTCRAILEGSRGLRLAVRAEAILRRSPKPLPKPLEAIIGERLSRLSRDQLRILQIGAVIDAPVDARLLTKLSPELEQSMDQALSELERRRLLIRISADDDRFDLADEYTSAAALHTVSREQRAVLHRCYADSLAGRANACTPERAALIGHHYDRAGAFSLAGNYLLAGGRGFMNVFAPEEAAMLLRRSWELFNQHWQRGHVVDEQTSPRAAAGLAFAAALNSLDRPKEAAVVLDELEPTEFGVGDLQSAGATYIQAGWTRYTGGRNPSIARDLVERGLALTEGKPGAQLHAGMARVFLARIEATDGNTARVLEHAESLLNGSTGAGNTVGQAIGSILAADGLCDAGRLEEAWRNARYAIQIVKAGGSGVAAAIVFAMAAKVHVFRGDSDEALLAAARGRTAAQASGDQAGALAHAAAWSGMAHLLRGEPREAMRYFEAVAQRNPYAPTGLSWLARGHLELGHHIRARDLAERCLAEGPPRLIRSGALRTLALALAREGEGDTQANLEQAEQHAKESVRLSDRLGLRPHAAWGRLALAEILLRQGRRGEAERLVAQAVRTLQDCGMQPPAPGFLDRIEV